jgi:23S rRNA (cytosine1962-C5)-methyltransferase
VGQPVEIDSSWWNGRIEAALGLRRKLFDRDTTGYRCLNGESDGWPGLVLDRYAETLVLKIYSGVWLPRLHELRERMEKKISNERIVLRLSRNIRKVASEKFGVTDGAMLEGNAPGGPVRFLENGLHFEADVMRGQKTGFFLDQRENRREVERLAAGRTVLNAFSFTGGFSIYAARGGAGAVTSLDLSRHALEGAARNFALNAADRSISGCQHALVKADAFAWLARNSQRKFDLIVLDPPSLAKREAERAGAIRAYARLARSAVFHLRPGGILVACSCSAHVTAEEFFGSVRGAVQGARRKFSELQTSGPAPDHPAKFKEANYLKAIYLKVD